jgi:methyl-accepting chemotaxis protein-1 (serine sensor receptor)
VGIAAAVFCALGLHRAISAPLSRMLGHFGEISRGNLTEHIVVTSQDEMGALTRGLQDMQRGLIRTIETMSGGSDSIASATKQIDAANLDLSQRTEEQASSLEETASSMEEMTSTVRQNADNARQANQLASGAREQAEKGGEVVGRVVGAMGAINDSSKEIADIIGVIDEIAFQTNLLALNAAVEAARAGEQGRGFAVVAAEVRNLAQRSAGAAKEIKSLIKDSVDKVEEGSRLVDESGSTLEEIVNSVKKVSDIIAEIAAASEEQSQGIEQVNKAVTQLDEVTQQNAALVEEAAAASEAMDDQAQGLTTLMDRFHTGDQEYTETPAAATTPRKQVRAAAPAARKPAPRRAATPKTDDEWEEF